MTTETPFDVLIRAQTKLVVIQSADRDRVYTALIEACEEELESSGGELEVQRELFVFSNDRVRWLDPATGRLVEESSSSGNSLFELIDSQLNSVNARPNSGGQSQVARTIKDYRTARTTGNTILAIEDAGAYLAAKPVVGSGTEARDIRLALRQFVDPKQNASNSKMVVLLSESRLKLDELRHEAMVVDFPLPTDEELRHLMLVAMNDLGMEKEDMLCKPEFLSHAALGLCGPEAEKTFKQVAVGNEFVFDKDSPAKIMEAKKEIIKNHPSEAMEYISEGIPIEQIGGLDILLEWVKKKERSPEKKAKWRKRNGKAAKGVLFIGPPGTGKSLTAKAVAGILKVPMVRFDVAKVYGSYVGESETTLNECLRLAEAVSPCVLWMDEIEKALAGTSGGRTGDGGVGTRVFGQLLTWMNEKKSEVFLVATANNLDSIIANSPELLRRGRLDEIFFIDYPGEKARKKIFEIHLGNLAFDSETGQPMTQFVDLDSFDTEHLARLTEQWTGAEIEAVINEANEGAFLIGEDYPLTQDIITELISETTCDYERLEDREQKSISAMRAQAQKIGKRASSQD